MQMLVYYKFLRIESYTLGIKRMKIIRYVT